MDGSAPVLQALAAGQAQIGRPGPAPVLNARARGVDVVFIYNALPKSSFGITVKRDDPYKQVTDLKGKTIGTGTRDGAEVGFARAILNDAGMQEGKDFTFIPVGDGGPATAGFLRGDIQAYVAATSRRRHPQRPRRARARYHAAEVPVLFRQRLRGHGRLHRQEPGRDRRVRARHGAGDALHHGCRRTATPC